MTDEEAVDALRVASARLTPSRTARLIEQYAEEGLQQSTLVFLLKRAVPAIPLKVLLDAQAWTAVGGDSSDDDEFDRMLLPWWPARLAITSDHDA